MAELKLVAPAFIDQAWRDGAHLLSEACEQSGGEITVDQLKMLLSRGERTLLAIMQDGTPKGWVVVRLDQLPNVRALHVCELYAPGATFDECRAQLWEYARQNGCSEVRCSAKPAHARLYRMRWGFEPVYTTLMVKI